MPTYATPAPIIVELSLLVATVRITATDRTDTVVEVRPTREGNKHDTQAADQTHISFGNGRLTVKQPKPKLLGNKGTIDVTIEVPTGSTLRGEAAVAELRTQGRLGECRFHTSSGDLEVAQAGPVRLETSAGRISMEQASGHTEVTTGTGELWLREIDGTAVIKNSNGVTTLGNVTGDLRVSVANGDVSIERAHATVAVKSATGSIRVGEIIRGAILLETGVGDVEVGIRQGTAAYLDLRTITGRVINDLAAVPSPDTTAETAKITAHTMTGDLFIHRTQPAAQ